MSVLHLHLDMLKQNHVSRQLTNSIASQQRQKLCTSSQGCSRWRSAAMASSEARSAAETEVRGTTGYPRSSSRSASL